MLNRKLEICDREQFKIVKKKFRVHLAWNEIYTYTYLVTALTLYYVLCTIQYVITLEYGAQIIC